MTDQSDKVAWITGASSGIGAALAKEFVAGGGKTVLSGRNIGALEDVASDCGGSERCFILPFEVTDYARIPALVEKATGWQGRVDVLVNNAGISQRSLAHDTQFSVYQQIVEIDLLAPIALTQAVLPALLAQQSGAIINISSVAGKVGVPMRTAYCAAKHGLIGYGDALRTEVAGQGIQVLNIAPGSVRTNVSRNALSGDGSVRGKSDAAIDNGLDPADVARIIWDALEDGKREVVIAEGTEASMPELRAKEPDKLFDLMEALVAGGYAQQMDG